MSMMSLTSSSRWAGRPVRNDNQVPANHEMALVGPTEAGWEEWHCPQCDRRLLLHLRPYEKLVIWPGDERVNHAGSKGLARMGPVSVQPVETEEARRWLSDNGIQWGG